MRVSRIRLATLALISSVALGGCAYDMYGDPYGYGYGYAPRSSVSIGVGYGGYGYGGYDYGFPYGGYGYGSYGNPYGMYGYGYPYSGYSYPYGGYGYDPFGWYGDYYYPGSGIYVYDRSRARHVWSNDQQRYWSQRRQQWQGRSRSSIPTSENWSGWDRSRSRDHSGTTATTGGWSHGTGNWSRANVQSGAPTASTNKEIRGERGGHGWRRSHD